MTRNEYKLTQISNFFRSGGESETAILHIDLELKERK